MLPILFQNPDFILYSYPLLMGIGWGVAYQLFFSLVPTDIPRRFPLILYWGIFVCAWIGAKILFYFTLPEVIASPLMGQLSFWTGGGFVFYGGLLGGMLFVLIYKALGFPFSLHLLWALLPALSIGHGIGRIGCFLAGCCYGKVTDLWWGIHLHGHDRHPTQLLEAVALFGMGLFLWKSKQSRFLLTIYYLLGYGLLRFGVELLRGDIVRGSWGPLTPSQWISLLMVLLGLTGALIYKKQPLENT